LPTRSRGRAAHCGRIRAASRRAEATHPHHQIGKRALTNGWRLTAPLYPLAFGVTAFAVLGFPHTFLIWRGQSLEIDEKVALGTKTLSGLLRTVN
jgi:hypothetical protein